jgi:hypothetical protein
MGLEDLLAPSVVWKIMRLGICNLGMWGIGFLINIFFTY